jgi:hypothetical protein
MLPTDRIVHAGFDMELATCPAGDSNRTQSLISKAAPVELWSLDHKSIIDELVERAVAFESDEDDKDEGLPDTSTTRTKWRRARPLDTVYRQPPIQNTQTHNVSH